MQPGAFGELPCICDVPHAPFGIVAAQAGIERRVARRGVRAVALKRSVQKQSAVRTEVPRRAGNQAFGDAPWRNVDHVGAEHRKQQSRAAAVMHLGAPCRIGQVDPERRADVAKLRMRPPRVDAAKMRLVEVARPPRNRGRPAREIHHMLPGAAAGLEHVPGFSVEEWFELRPDRLAIAMKRRRIEPAVGRGRPAILAEFDNIVGHRTRSPAPSFRGAPLCANPKSRATTCGFRVRGFASPRNDVYVGARPTRTPVRWRRAAKGENVRAGFWRGIPLAKRTPSLGRRTFLRLGAAVTGALALRQGHAETPITSPPADAAWSQTVGPGVVDRPYGRPAA